MVVKPAKVSFREAVVPDAAVREVREVREVAWEVMENLPSFARDVGSPSAVGTTASREYPRLQGSGIPFRAR